MSFKKSVASTFSLNAITFFIGLANSIFAARLLGAEGRGVFALYTSSIELFSLLLGLGLPHGLIYFAAKDHLRRDILFGSSVLYLLSATAAFYVIVVLILKTNHSGLLLISPYNQTVDQVLITLNFATLLGWYLFISILNGHRLFTTTNFISLVSIIATFAFYFVIYSLFRQETVSPRLFFLIQVCVGTVILSLCIFYNIRRVSFSITLKFPALKEIRQIFKYSIAVYGSNIMVFANMKLDYWFVNHYVGAASLGHYTLASNVALTLLLLPNSAGLVLTAFKANNSNGDADHWISFICRIIFMISLGASIFLWFLGKPIVEYLYGEDFQQSAVLLNVLLIGIIPYCVFTVLRNYFAGAGKTSYLLICSGLGLFLTIVLDIILIPLNGALGAAYATVVAYTVSAVLAAALFTKIKGVPLLSLFVLTKSDIVLVANFVRSQIFSLAKLNHDR